MPRALHPAVTELRVTHVRAGLEPPVFAPAPRPDRREFPLTRPRGGPSARGPRPGIGRLGLLRGHGGAHTDDVGQVLVVVDPGPRARAQGELLLEQRVLVEVRQARHPHAQEADRAEVHRIRRQRPGHRDDRLERGRALRQRVRAADRREIRALDLHRHRAGGTPVAQQPTVRGLRRPSYRRGDLTGRGQVGGERALRADLLGLGPLVHRPVVVPARDPGDRRAHRPAQGVRHVVVVHRGQVADRRHPELGEPLPRHRAHAPQAPDRQRVQHPFVIAARDHRDPVRLGQLGRDLGVLLARPRTDRGRQPRGLADRRPQILRPAPGAVHVRSPQLGRLEERLVHGHLLDHRRVLGEHLEHPAAQRAVHRHPRRDEHRRRADEPPGLVRRHRRPRPERPRLVRASRHHAAAALPAHEHRPTPQGRPGELLAGGEERVHVHVQDPAVLPVGHRRLRRITIASVRVGSGPIRPGPASSGRPRRAPPRHRRPRPGRRPPRNRSPTPRPR